MSIERQRRCGDLDIERFGYDMHLPRSNGRFLGVQGDIVTCFHTLEHCRKLPAAIAELERITEHQLFVIVPKQRYQHHTPDLHLQFFYSARYLQSLFSIAHCESQEVDGDLVLMATKR